MDEEEYADMARKGYIQSQTQDNASRAAQYYLQEQEKGLADAQLEVDSIKSEVFHILKQDQLREDKSGKFDWKPLSDHKQRTLTDWGVDRIMQIIHFYINKNTLLSNFLEEHINRLMLKFVRELNDLVLLKYRDLFYEPSFEECKQIVQQNIENKKKMKRFSLEILGKKVNEEEVEKEVIEQMQKSLEEEINKVKNEERKKKLREYGLIIAQLEMIVFATLNRAFRGEERGSLRRHMNVSEIIGNKPPSHESQKGGLFSWGKK